jgi:hypothetical protein
LSCHEHLQPQNVSPKFREKKNSFTLSTPNKPEHYAERECRFSKYDDREEEGYVTPKNQTKRESSRDNAENSPTNKSGRKITLDSMNSFAGRAGAFDNLMIKREMSFGPAGINTAQPQKKIAYDEDEDEDSPLKSGRKKIFCNCKKSKCLKLYCDCFARGEFCGKDCNCSNCANNDTNAEERESAMVSTLDRNPNAFKPKVDKTESPISKAELLKQA